MIRTITTLGLAALLAVPALAEAQQQKKAQRPNAAQSQQVRGARELLGTYTIMSGSSAGEEIPEDRLNGRVRITEDQMFVTDRDDNEVYVIDYEFEGPEGGREMGRRVLMTTVRSSQEGAEGSTARGLLKVEGETVTLIYDFGDGEQYPEDFEAEKETENLFVMEKGGGEVEEAAPAAEPGPVVDPAPPAGS